MLFPISVFYCSVFMLQFICFLHGQKQIHTVSCASVTERWRTLPPPFCQLTCELLQTQSRVLPASAQHVSGRRPTQTATGKREANRFSSDLGILRISQNDRVMFSEMEGSVEQVKRPDCLTVTNNNDMTEMTTGQKVAGFLHHQRHEYPP